MIIFNCPEQLSSCDDPSPFPRECIIHVSIRVYFIREIKLYRRLEKKDKKVFSFIEEKEAAYNLVSDNVRSTLASRNKAENTTVRLVSESIYNRLIMYLSNKWDVNKRMGI